MPMVLAYYKTFSALLKEASRFVPASVMLKNPHSLAKLLMLLSQGLLGKEFAVPSKLINIREIVLLAKASNHGHYRVRAVPVTITSFLMRSEKDSYKKLWD